MTDATFDTVVIGSGLAGASAARMLYARGIKTLVLEASTELGGRARAWAPKSGSMDDGDDVSVAYDVGGGFFASQRLDRVAKPDGTFSYLASAGIVQSLVEAAVGPAGVIDSVAATDAQGTVAQAVCLTPEQSPEGGAEPTVFDEGFLGFNGVPPDLAPQEAIGFLLLLRQILAFQTTYSIFQDPEGANGLFKNAAPPTGSKWAMAWNVADMDAVTVTQWLRGQQAMYPLFITDRLISVLSLSAQFTLGNDSEGVNLYWMIETVMRSGGYLFTQTRQFENLTSAAGMQTVVENILGPLLLRDDGSVRTGARVTAVGKAPAGSPAPVAITYLAGGHPYTVYADHVVCAMAPVDASRITFTPAKPVLGKLQSGTMIKAIITYQKPEWRDAWQKFTGIVAGVNQVSFTQDVSVPETGTYALTCYIIGAAALELIKTALGDDYGKVDPNGEPRVTALLLERCRANVSYFFSVPELSDNADFGYWAWWDSGSAPGIFSIGAGSGFFEPGAFYKQKLNDVLRDPIVIDGVARIIFAGAEYSTVNPASMEGAVISGRDAGLDVVNEIAKAAGAPAKPAPKTAKPAPALKVAARKPIKESGVTLDPAQAVACMLQLLQVLGGLLLMQDAPQDPAADPASLLLDLWNNPLDGQSVVGVAANNGFPRTDQGGEELLKAISDTMVGPQSMSPASPPSKVAQVNAARAEAASSQAKKKRRRA
uniref:monoamine oxidase n=1 Tax=Sexangularia sp. CB-2014 TaxID=1486929 RepID=A0A7S1YFD2_9EUKA|mmetsp:Transcript_16627/g.52001  ORF Transcript_16627/g.52001 Transcript_16627/m.52001 type:complete len:710 (+) Transcript_16627:153-2282(+)